MDDDHNESKRRQNQNRGRRHQAGRAEVYVDIPHYQDDFDSDSGRVRRSTSVPPVRSPRASLLRGPASDLLARELVRGSVAIVVNEGGD